jgi:hypothetical protein
MKRMIQLAICLVLLLATTFPVVASPLAASIPCNPKFVQQNGNKITVLPTGNENTGDTVNLQCAFNAATNHGSEVHLIRGTYRTAQIVVNNFDGRFTGAGKDKTHIYNLPNLIVTQFDMNNPAAPSASNSWPSLFSFVNGKIYVADLAIHIQGVPTTGWTIFGMVLKDLALGIAVLGTKTDAYVENILVEGERMTGSQLQTSLQGFNLINGVFFEGYIGNVPISGSIQVRHSTFRNLDSGTPIFNLKRATAVFSHNTYRDVVYGMDGGGMVNSSLEFLNNEVHVVNGIFLGTDEVPGEGMFLYPMPPYVTEEVGSTFLIRNNTFRGTNGPHFDMMLGEGNHCLIKGNSLQNGLIITIGTGAQECIVKN